MWGEPWMHHLISPIYAQQCQRIKTLCQIHKKVQMSQESFCLISHVSSSMDVQTTFKKKKKQWLATLINVEKAKSEKQKTNTKQKQSKTKQKWKRKQTQSETKQRKAQKKQKQSKFKQNKTNESKAS